uniref:Uncharacterized protein n=1 Tax=Kalanchoe fedtschenkoi TaxID=63787 RepID=A0A7N0TTL6_KALFE
MALHISILTVLALFVVCATALEGETREGWFPGPAGETKPVSPTIIGVRGAIYCQKGAKLTPIQGACAKVTCAAKGKKPFTIISAPTDKKGMFMATLSLYEVEKTWDLKKDCKAYLHSSPLKTCHVATNVNKGLSGAPLKTYKSFAGQHMKVFYVGPFTFRPT